MTPILIVGGPHDGHQVESNLPTIRLISGAVKLWDGIARIEVYERTVFVADNNRFDLYCHSGMTDSDVIRLLIQSHSKPVIHHIP